MLTPNYMRSALILPKRMEPNIRDGLRREHLHAFVRMIGGPGVQPCVGMIEPSVTRVGAAQRRVADRPYRIIAALETRRGTQRRKQLQEQSSSLPRSIESPVDPRHAQR